MREMEAKGIALKATEQPVDTSTPAGRAFLQMLGIFAEFETSLRKERQLEGIAKAKEAGFKGTQATIELMRGRGFGKRPRCQRGSQTTQDQPYDCVSPCHIGRRVTLPGGGGGGGGRPEERR